MSMQKMLSELKEMMEGAEGKVVKTLPMRKEWRKAYQEWDTASSIAKKASAKASTKKSAFWAMVESDLETYDKTLRYNEKTDEIEVYADEDDTTPGIEARGVGVS